MPPGNCGISERSYNDVAARIDDFIWCQWAEVGRLTWHGDDEGLGLMLSGSYDRRSLSQQGLGTFSGYTRYKDSSGTVRYGNSDARPEEIQEHRQNTGLDAAVQWRPTADTEITAHSFYSHLKSNRGRWWLSFTPTAGLSNATYSPDDILLSGTATGPVLTNTEFANTKADV